MGRTKRDVLVVVMGLGLMAAACGADNGSDSGDQTSAATTPLFTSQPPTTDVPETTTEPTAAPGITIEDLLGTWTYGGYVQEFKVDGTYTVGSSDKGRYSLDGDIYTEVQDADRVFCPGVVGTYTIQLTEQGELLRTLVKDPCPRAALMDGKLWVRVE
jgi:hypothetical protein